MSCMEFGKGEGIANEGSRFGGLVGYWHAKGYRRQSLDHCHHSYTQIENNIKERQRWFGPDQPLVDVFVDSFMPNWSILKHNT